HHAGVGVDVGVQTIASHGQRGQLDTFTNRVGHLAGGRVATARRRDLRHEPWLTGHRTALVRDGPTHVLAVAAELTIGAVAIARCATHTHPVHAHRVSGVAGPTFTRICAARRHTRTTFAGLSIGTVG